MTYRWNGLGVVMLAGALSLGGCGGGSDDTTGTGGGTGGGTTPVTTATLAGGWHATVDSILNANTASTGALGISCPGQLMHWRFESDTAFFSRWSDVLTCTSRGLTFTGRLSQTGRYSASGDQLTVSGIENFGSVTTSTGVSLPFSIPASAGSATYAISGNTLTLTFTDPSVGTVTQTWTRD